LFRIRAKETREQARQHNLFSLVRTEESTIEDTLLLLENHFGFEGGGYK